MSGNEGIMDGRHMGNDRQRKGDPSDEDLLTLLDELVEEHGRMKAAKLLRINNKTLAVNLNDRQITLRVREALELYRYREAPEPPWGETPEVEEDSGLPEVIEAFSRRLSDLEGRVDRIETGEYSQLSGNGDESTTENIRAQHGVITIESLADEDWGEEAELVVEWRELRHVHPDRDDGSLNWAVHEIRRLEVELTLLETYGLTLPPEVLPLSQFKRADAISWRREALRTAVVRRRKRRLRRVVTLGIKR